MADTYIIGKVAMTFRGEYNASTSYEKLDVITYNGTSYGVLQACTGVTPPNATYYQVLAQKGTDGQDRSIRRACRTAHPLITFHLQKNDQGERS